MAEGLLRQMAGDRFDIYSAGFHPMPIHPLVYTVMEEIGIDISGQTPKCIDLYLGTHLFDYIILCQETESECSPLHRFALHIDYWPLPDPAETTGDSNKVADAFRNSRDTLEMKIEEWLGTLKPASQD